MLISDTERKILLRIYSICYISLNEKIYIGLLYDLSSKNHLWNTIKVMENKGIIISSFSGRKKYIYLSDKGIKIVNCIKTIDNL